VDTSSFADALKSALRQDPDVILVGRCATSRPSRRRSSPRKRGTSSCRRCTPWTPANDQPDRGVVPPFQQKQIRLQLASVLKAVISQRLLPRADGQGRVPAAEILLNTARIREYIEDKDKTRKIREAIAQGFVSYGCRPSTSPS